MEPDQDRAAPFGLQEAREENVVAAAAARLLAEADRAVEDLRAEAEHAQAEVRAAIDDAKARVESIRADEDLRAALEAEIRADRDRIAEIGSDLARVHGQLDKINAGIIGLQTHSLRQTGVAALALAVLVAIAWKVIGG